MKNNLKYILTFAAISALMIALVGCSTIADTQKSAGLPVNARWALLPVINNAQVPLAGHKAEAVISTLLRKRGVTDLVHYPLAIQDSSLPQLNDVKRYVQALSWAKQKGFEYGISGSVSEWSYKTGLDGEPAVGLTINVIDIASGQVVWAASGAQSGWGYDSVSGVAQSLIRNLIDEIPLKIIKSKTIVNEKLPEK